MHPPSTARATAPPLSDNLRHRAPCRGAVDPGRRGAASAPAGRSRCRRAQHGDDKLGDDARDLYLQDTQGASPTTAGLLLLPCSVGVAVGSAAAAPLVRRCSALTGIAIGLAVIGTGVACLLAVPVAEMLLPVGAAIAGAGLGVSSVAANTLGTGVLEALEGTASGLLNTSAQLGTALGVSSLLLVASIAGRSLGWACAAAMAVTAAAVLARRVGTRMHPTLAATDEPVL
jgi:hypothetical protein